jgi:hypothetical protein
MLPQLPGSNVLVQRYCIRVICSVSFTYVPCTALATMACMCGTQSLVVCIPYGSTHSSAMHAMLRLAAWMIH